jgi:hypothetical protein
MRHRKLYIVLPAIITFAIYAIYHSRNDVTQTVALTEPSIAVHPNLPQKENSETQLLTANAEPIDKKSVENKKSYTVLTQNDNLKFLSQSHVVEHRNQSSKNC